MSDTNTLSHAHGSYRSSKLTSIAIKCEHAGAKVAWTVAKVVRGVGGERPGAGGRRQKKGDSRRISISVDLPACFGLR